MMTWSGSVILEVKEGAYEATGPEDIWGWGIARLASAR